jgi:hypothetical protein
MQINHHPDFKGKITPVVDDDDDNNHSLPAAYNSYNCHGFTFANR